MTRPTRLAIVPIACAATLVLTSCIPGVETARERRAFISAVALEAGLDVYATQPIGAFYRVDGLSAGIGQVETCRFAAYSPIPPNVATLPTLPAGERLYTDIGGRRDTLFRTSSLGVETYQLRSGGAIPYTPGDTLFLEVPGDDAGFPAANILVRTAEPFVFDEPGEGTEGQPLTVTWTASPLAGSLMTVSLRFNSIGGSDDPNAQIYCTFTDDGSGEVPANLTSSWIASAPASRSHFATRIRYTELVIDSRTSVTLLSYFERPTPPLP